jgi:formylmethanofuran dehydrogenase subunit B
MLRRTDDDRPAPARIDGEACSLPDAIEEAGRRLTRSRRTVFWGLGCDTEGVRAAVRLARMIDAIIDPAGEPSRLHGLDVMRDAGLFLTTPGEVRARADTVLLVGAGAFDAWPGLADGLAVTKPRLAAADASRRVLWLGARKGASSLLPGIHAIASSAAGLRDKIAALRAGLAGHRDVTGFSPRARFEQLLAVLREAKFGVAVWAEGDLDRLTLEMLAGLVRDLNATTRFSCLPLAHADNLAGVVMALTWLTGYPSAIGFRNGDVEHDPWRFDAARLARRAEADLALSISAYRHLGEGPRSIPTIALTAKGRSPSRQAPLVEIVVGQPGIDHDAIDFAVETGGLAFRAASAPSDTPSVTCILDQLRAALPSRRSSPP